MNSYPKFALDDDSVDEVSGNTLMKVIWNTDIEAEFAWLLMGYGFDMKKTDGGCETTAYKVFGVGDDKW